VGLLSPIRRTCARRNWRQWSNCSGAGPTRPLRLLPAHRTPADPTTCLAAFAVNQLSVATGLFMVSFWG
jgi:hypothetical protein